MPRPRTRSAISLRAGLLLLIALFLTTHGPAALSGSGAVEAQQAPPSRTVELEPGWNLVGWTGETAPAEATASIEGEFGSLWTWDAGTQSFRNFLPGPAGALVSSLTDLRLGDGVWILVTNPGGAAWEQPAFSGSRSVDLAPGFNLVMWTGADGTPVADAVASLGATLEVLFTYDALSDRFLSHRPAAAVLTPPGMELNFGDGVWVRVSSATTWEQPAGGGAPPASTVEVNSRMALTLPAPPPLEDGTPRPLAAVMGADGTPGYFVENELWLSTDSASELAAFLERWDGAVVSEIDPDAAGFDMPKQYLVRVNPPLAEVDSFLNDLQSLDPSSRSDIQVSSPEGLALLAAGAADAAAGMTVGVNWVGQGGDVSSRSTSEAPTGDTISGDAYAPDAFSWQTHSVGSIQDIGVAEAWRALALGNKLGNKVDIAILDMGFQPDTDTPAGLRSVSNVPFVSALGTSNLGSCGSPCPWHGTNVMSAAMAVVDNGFGSAGPAGQIARPILVFTSYDFFTGIGALIEARALGAEIANMSYGAGVPAVLSWSVIPFEVATGLARASGMLLFAAAGNDGLNVDAEDCFIFCWEETLWTPCENVGVICVGGIGWDSKNKAGGSNYGPEAVDIFAPYTMRLGPDPSAPANAARSKSGTSFSSPFAAGVAAMIWAARPDFSANQVAETLFRTAHTSPDPLVNRYVNAFEAVRDAMGDVPPFIEIRSPLDGASFSQGGTSVGFSAFAEDFEDGTPTVSWSSSRDGVIGSGTSFSRRDLSVGTHTVTATATDSRGQMASDSVTFQITATAPIVAIIFPAGATMVCSGESITLTGTSFFAGQTPIGPLPDAQVSWSSSLSGVLGTGHMLPVSLGDGIHLITFTGSPPGGLAASALTTVTVETCSDTPPVVAITTPAADTGTSNPAFVFDGFDAGRGQFYKDVFLAGSATDAEDGPLSGADLVWTTSRTDLQPAALGTGTSLTVRLYSTDPCGSTHLITLRATDSDFNVRSAVRVIHVWSLC